MNNLLNRLQSETPKFFKTVRNIGIICAAIGGVLIAAPVALPVAVVTAGGYLLTAGAVCTAVAQSVTKNEN